MSDTNTNYQCPQCTGPLRYDGAKGKLVCDFCEGEFTTAEIEELYKDKDDKAAKALEYNTQEEWVDEDMSAYSCPSCGAELICDATTAATSCPYCGNPTIVPGQFAGTLKPDLIIPFKLDKNTAINNLKKHYEGKFLLPKQFKDQNHIDEIKGVYVPFWLFDYSCEADVDMNGTKVYTKDHATYVEETTEYYRVARSGSIDYDKIPVDASLAMPDDHMDSIEPYNYDDLTEFSTAYMPGFLANKYDVSIEEASSRSELRAKNTIIDSLSDDPNNYSTLNVTNSDVRFTKAEAKYAMLPVWMLSTSWEGKNFLFAMNGQTGKMVGDLPVDSGKRLRFGILTAIISFVVCCAVCSIMNMDTITWPAIAAAIITVCIIGSWNMQLKSIKKETTAAVYIKPDSFNVTNRSDVFLRRKVERKNKDTNNK